MRMFGLVLLFLIAALLVSCTGGDSATTSTAPPPTTAPGAAPTTAPPVVTSTTESLDQNLGPIAAPVRHPAVERPIYFVMPDRFENGDPSNDEGGLAGGPLVTGFLPADKGFHHGGDLAGLIDRLPYIHDLGVGAIWITPPFTNRFVQGNGTIEGSSSSYHGYWQIDWDRIDPHLGTEDDMRRLIERAHELGMSVYFDIVINHTGDVITYAEESFAYLPMTGTPYLSADGEEFDPTSVAGSDEFPALDPQVSFPYTPIFSSSADASVKSPAWLNDVTLYHNRGNSTFSGESSLFGDFFGLDDLFTEHPVVVEGMTELYTGIIERYDIDGFRIDTMKHVDLAFWQTFAPAIQSAGGPGFFSFGEVFDSAAILHSSFTNVGVPATLDFILEAALERYVAEGQSGERLADAFDDDDWFTDADNNASMQVKFFGNHDVGRMGLLIDRANPSADEAELLQRMQLGFDLLFFTRGVPVVYYGDEQGFVGDGGDQLARQSMFPSLTPEYLDDDNIGSDASPADDNFDQTHPLYRWIAELAELRSEHRALVTGAQLTRHAEGPIFAFSRLDRDERIEYVVVANNSRLTVPARFVVASADTDFDVIRPQGSEVVRSDAAGEILVEVAPLSTVLLRAATPLALPADAPEVGITRPTGTEIPTVRYRIEADVADERYAEVTFAVAVDGGEPVIIGTDDAPPYRVYWNNAAHPTGASVDIIATVDDGSGRLRSDVVAVVLGDREGGSP